MNLYHISDDFLGEDPLLSPRVPKYRMEGRCIYHKYLKKQIKEDGRLPRVCVSNKISGCLSAVAASLKNNFFVYLAVKPRYVSRDLPLMLVPDAKKTGERWILKRTKFKLVGTIMVTNPQEYKWRWVEKLKD